MGHEQSKLPDNLAELVVADMKQRAIDAGTTLPEILKKALASQIDPDNRYTLRPDDLK